MKLKKLILPTILISVFFYACDVDKTQQAEAPELDVDVEAEEGQMPKYEVDWADVNIATRTKIVTVPKVVIAQEEKEVEVPYVEIEYPEGNQELEERTIVVEAQVSDEMHEINIQKVYASEDNLIVLANLESTGQNLQDQTVRVSDQIILKAPEDLNVKKYIIGSKPEGEFNNQHKYISDQNRISDKIDNSEEIYSSI